jgi:hypothetical protein
MNQKVIKQLFFLGFIFVIGISIFLYYNYKTNDFAKIYLKNGGFKRIKDNTSLKLVAEYSLPKDVYDLVDFDSVGNLIIRPYGQPQVWLLGDKDINTKINLPKEVNIKNITGTERDFYKTNSIDLQCPNDKKIYSLNLTDKKLRTKHNLDSYIDKAVSIAEEKMVSFRAAEKDNFSKLFLTVWNSGKEKMIRKSSFSLHDMSEDGVLKSYGKDLLFINYYNNQVYVIDTGLVKKGTFKTIDTITTKPPTISMKNKTVTKFIHAPRIVNRIMSVNGDFLYVNSFVKGDNDKDQDFTENNIIDIYDLKANGHYRGTLYIPKYEKQYFSDFIIKNKSLVLSYPDKIIKYEINL